MKAAFAYLFLAALPAALAQERQPLRVVPLQAETHHVQGIDVSETGLWVSSVDRKTRKGFLYRFELATGNPAAQVEVQDGERYHPGGIALDDGTLWVPVAEYHRAGSSRIERRDARSLALLSHFMVQDHIGCIAAAPDALIGGNWDSRDLYFWDRAGRLRRKVPNSTGNRYQDLKFHAGRLVASGVLSAEDGAVDWLALPSLTLEKRLPFGRTDRGVRFNNEGMAIRGSRLYLLPEDGPSRLFVFPLD